MAFPLTLACCPCDSEYPPPRPAGVAEGKANIVRNTSTVAGAVGKGYRRSRRSTPDAQGLEPQDSALRRHRRTSVRCVLGRGRSNVTVTYDFTCAAHKGPGLRVKSNNATIVPPS